MEIKIVRKVLEENESLAAKVRAGLRERRQSMVNFMSSPGSGKTKILERLIPLLTSGGLKVGVIEGDITTSLDAQRLQPLGIPISQINTELFGGDCHLGAHVILAALEQFAKEPIDVVTIENVGNLVCPAEFDTGADLNIVVLSVTEGEDKPLKYPLMFRNSHLALINKIDLAEAAEADICKLKENMLKINSSLAVLETSGKTGRGIGELAQYIVRTHRQLLNEYTIKIANNEKTARP
ncbi:MAG: hydrogenase nickel incorporation protein HypB [Deltaproteobacteria bacterium]|nr:hydrogenase nickel incorporation protein HypB [Deltaproteobacteria bacterium]